MIREFVNPSTAKDGLPTRTRPAISIVAGLNPADPTALTELEKEMLRVQLYDYKDKLSFYKYKEMILLSFCTFIYETISWTNLIYTLNCDMAHDMLVGLKEQVSSINQARKIELISCY